LVEARRQLWVSSASGTSTSGTVAVTSTASPALDVQGTLQLGTSNITVSNAAGNLLEAAIADGTVYTRNAGAETVTGSWVFDGGVPEFKSASAIGLRIRARVSDEIGTIDFFNSGGGTVGRILTSGNDSLQLAAAGPTTLLTLTSSGITPNVRILSGSAQPGFLCFNSATDNYGASGNQTVECDTEVFDQAGNLDNATDTFTAPVTGHYHFCTSVQVTSAGEGFQVNLITSNRAIRFANLGGAGASENATGCVVTDMDVSDTAFVRVIAAPSSWSIDGDATTLVSWFSGRLVP
jgi:hypothetical protein